MKKQHKKAGAIIPRLFYGLELNLKSVNELQSEITHKPSHRTSKDSPRLAGYSRKKLIAFHQCKYIHALPVC